MADPVLPDLSQYNLSVSPYEGLIPIATQFGLGPQFGGADYIAAREAGYNDAEIISFLKAYPYLDTNNISGKLAAGQGPQIIQAATPNLAGSDPRRAALVNPNPPSTAIPDAQYGIPGRGSDPSVQMYNANVDVRGNDTYTQLMQASQLGTLVIAKDPPVQTFWGGMQDNNTYKLIDSATGNIIVDGVSPGQNKGTYQFTFGNPQSEGSVTAVIAANPDTGQVGTINPQTQMSYQSGLGGGMLSGLVENFLQVAPMALSLGSAGLGAEIASVLGLTDLGLSSAMAAKVGDALVSVAGQVATGQSLENAVQNVAINSVINTGAMDVAKGLQLATSNQTVVNAIGSAVAGAAQSAAKGGDSSTALVSALLSAGASTANTLSQQQQAAQTLTTSPGEEALGTKSVGSPTTVIGQLADQTPTGGGLTTEQGIGTAPAPTEVASNQGALAEGLGTTAGAVPQLPTISATTGTPDVPQLSPISVSTPQSTTPQLEPISVTAPKVPQLETITATLPPVPQLETITATLPPVPEIEPISVTLPPTPELEPISVTAPPEVEITTGQDGTPTANTSTQTPEITTITTGRGKTSTTAKPPQTSTGTQTKAGSSALAEALNLGNLGDPFFTSTGKKPRYVWNQASLRTGNETGVQSG